MNIVIAPDSFKECLTAAQVAQHIATGIRSVCPTAEIICIPIADGGEGTVEALVTATNGSIIRVSSVDALMRPVHSFFGVLGNGTTAVIEMAAASGIELIEPEKRNPMLASTFGTGLLIKEVLERGFNDIIIGIGGSATNDGGVGMAKALGYKFLDDNNREIGNGGGALSNLERIDTSGINPLLSKAMITVACDVTNPLCGHNGASAVFGPQKGATPEMVVALDQNLKKLAEVIQLQMDKEVAEIPGAGAAGGLGAGLLAFTNSTLKPGFEIVKEITQLEEQIRNADLIFTAEGKIDFQTQFGKTPFGVAQIAARYNVPVIALAGIIGLGAETLLEKGITAYYTISEEAISIEESIRNAANLIENRSSQIMRKVGNSGI
jgi:glycerate kinase